MLWMMYTFKIDFFRKILNLEYHNSECKLKLSSTETLSLWVLSVGVSLLNKQTTIYFKITFIIINKNGLRIQNYAMNKKLLWETWILNSSTHSDKSWCKVDMSSMGIHTYSTSCECRPWTTSVAKELNLNLSSKSRNIRHNKYPFSF